ncbi:DUF4834 family protein [Mucilaginibacter panaciglaebae]|uniref:DUF4834 family protein n=1 Tax=Mucilaginibacter panaciglaebae TaxID=502331 RepID=A0ABP7WVF6_9SPHI
MEYILHFIFYVIAILYLVRALLRWAIPALFQSVVNKAQQQHQQANYQGRRQEQAGRIKVDYVPEKKDKSNFTDKAGEFVDYEEVK